MATDVLTATGALATENVAVVAPETTVTLTGTVATEVLLLLIATRAPPTGAGPFSVTVPESVAPGSCSATVGAVTSTWTVTVAPVKELPARSVITGRRS